MFFTYVPCLCAQPSFRFGLSYHRVGFLIVVSFDDGRDPDLLFLLYTTTASVLTPDGSSSILVPPLLCRYRSLWRVSSPSPCDTRRKEGRRLEETTESYWFRLIISRTFYVECPFHVLYLDSLCPCTHRTFVIVYPTPSMDVHVSILHRFGPESWDQGVTICDTVPWQVPIQWRLGSDSVCSRDWV